MASSSRYSLTVIRDEVRYLVQQDLVSRRQPIYTLYKYIPAQEWEDVERELEENDFLPRDHIGDLIGYEEWGNDDT
ncbi:MAG: DUF4327 family protein [Oculatellaceae cyanobacterium bins.114]|nr:DUF4327 family protein [Oculatellaceae cyanobacterium bins.114]